MPVRNEADPRWDSLKSTIESLYSATTLEGTEGLMETMAKVHRFSKTKSQYESQFKIWGTRKYRKKDDWKSIGRNIAERKRAGKESNVYFNGDMILKSKVQKETRRHGFITALEQSRPAPIPPIPDGFEIRTPAADEIVSLPTLSGETPSSPIGMETVSSTLPSRTVISDASPNVLRNAKSPSPPRATTDLSPIQRQNAILHTPYAPEIRGSPLNVFKDLVDYFRRLRYVSDLPFYQFEDALHPQFESSLISKTTQISGFGLTLGTSLLPECTHDVSHRDVDVLHKMLKPPETLVAVFKALLPSENDQMILRSNYSHSDSASSKIFSLLIFAMANNFAGLNSVPIENITDFLNRHASTRLLQHILNLSGPESEAFAEKLFQAAILMEDARIVKVLLQKGLVPNDLVCVQGGAKYSPLEYSSMVWNIEITRLLLDAKLDVNKSIEGEKGSGGAIARAFLGYWRDDEHAHVPMPSEIVHMLLEAGARISWSELATWRLRDNQEVFDLLLEHAVNTKPCDQAWHRFAFDMEEYDNATATRIVTRFLEAGIDIETMKHGIRLPMSRPTPIDIAAEQGNFELVQLLLRSRVSSTRQTLSCAIRSRNKELIKLLLDDGGDFYTCEEGATKDWYVSERGPSPVPSPLSEAIRWEDAEILDLLREKGAWSRIVNRVTELGEFEDVLIAACVRGQLTTVRELLDYRPPNTFGNDLSDALVAAIHLNEDAIALSLFDAGANVNGGSYKARELDAVGKEVFDSASSIDTGTDEDFRKCSHRGPALVEALLQKNEHHVRLILDSDVNYDIVPGKPWTSNALEAAVEWSNIPIIEELISMDIPMPSAAVRLSVKKGDTKCTQLLVEAGADTSLALVSAVTNNDIELVEYLFSVGTDPANSEALLEAEALPDWLSMVERLLTEFARSYPCGRRGYGQDTFQKAIKEGNLALIDILLKAKLDFRFRFHSRPFEMDCNYLYDTITLLGDAIMSQHSKSLAILRRLLDEIGNPNIIVQSSSRDPCNRETALLAAIDTKEIQKVQLLVDAGANVNWPATKGVKRTPLQKAAEIGSFEITELLIKQGGLVNNEPAVRGGATALQLAAIGGYIGIAQLLLENDADVNAPAAKFYGRTALEGAAEHGRIDMLKLLWNAGAKFQGPEYEKARELAKKNGHMATWRYLETLYPSSE